MITNEIKRFVIVGVSASGKSTFARKLAKKVELPLFHVDTIMWRPNWEYIGDDETIIKIKNISNQSEWIIEGFLHKELIQELFEKADEIIYLDYPSWVSVWHYIKRSWQHCNVARNEMPGCLDSFSFSFLLRVVQKKEAYWLTKEIESGKFNDKLRVLKHPSEAKELLQTL